MWSQDSEGLGRDVIYKKKQVRELIEADRNRENERETKTEGHRM